MQKKVWIGLAILAVLAGGLWMLPPHLIFSKSAIIDRPYPVLERNLVNLDAWSKWWPGKRIADSVFEFNGQPLKIGAIMLNGFEATSVDDSRRRFVFQMAAEEGRKTRINFASFEPAGPGFLNKAGAFLNYFGKRDNISTWVETVKASFADTKKMYGMDIQQTRVTDSVLIALKQYFNHEPSTAEVYGLIKELKNYIATQGGKEDNFPMVNIYKEADTAYLTMVAIATGVAMPATDRYLLKKMELGYILKGEVKGGIATVKQAQDNLAAYAIDYEKTAPAISYQLWVTNRLQQPDTSQWVTQLYFPIFY